MSKKEIYKVITPEFRVHFPQVFEAKAAPGSTKEKYSLVMLFKNTEDISIIKDMVKRTVLKKYPDGVLPDGFVIPYKDGNLKDYAGYKDTIYMAASSLYAPGVLDETKQPIINARDFYAGCYARAYINAFVYFPTKANPLSKNGVSIGLQNVMKTNDGEPLVGGESAESAFESIPLPDGDATGLLEGGEKSILDVL